MVELDKILAEWGQLSAVDREKAVLATVVHVKGSAYRRPGARMLILPDGRRLGTISGGCLETDVARKAAWWTMNGQPSLRVYDTSTEDAAWEFGLGCNGVISVLLERAVTAPVEELLGFLRICRQQRRSSVLATVIATSSESACRVGQRLLCVPDGSIGGGLRGTVLEQAIAEEVRRSFREKSGRLLHLPDCDVFLEWVGMPQRLVVFGAGHDAQPLVRIAALLGWECVVADGRPAYANPARFPEAKSVRTLPANADISELPIDRETAVVLMTHNFPQDERLLPQILERGPGYLGMLGPRSRSEKLFQNVGLRPENYNIHSPIGLDIGSQTPEVIALAIVAEIQSVASGRTGGMLCGRTDSIHTAVPEVGLVGSPRPMPSEREVLEMCGVLEDAHV